MCVDAPGARIDQDRSVPTADHLDPKNRGSTLMSAVVFALHRGLISLVLIASGETNIH